MRRKQSENCFTKQANFFEISGRLKNRGKTTVFDWWREFRFGSKYREFKKKQRVRDCTSQIALNSNKRDGLKNPCLAQQEVACTLIPCRLFTHDWPVNFPPEDERLINGLLEGMYSIVFFACWNVDGAYKCRLCSSLTTDFSMQSCRNRIRISFWLLSISFPFSIFNFKLRNTKMYNFIAFSISNV